MSKRVILTIADDDWASLVDEAQYLTAQKRAQEGASAKPIKPEHLIYQRAKLKLPKPGGARKGTGPKGPRSYTAKKARAERPTDH